MRIKIKKTGFRAYKLNFFYFVTLNFFLCVPDILRNKSGR